MKGFDGNPHSLVVDVSSEVFADAPAALGVIRRSGVGKLRHMNTNHLWIQEAAAPKSINHNKSHTSSNPADLLTKHLKQEAIEKHSYRICLKFCHGRSATAAHCRVLLGFPF